MCFHRFEFYLKKKSENSSESKTEIKWMNCKLYWITICYSWIIQIFRSSWNTQDSDNYHIFRGFILTLLRSHVQIQHSCEPVFRLCWRFPSIYTFFLVSGVLENITVVAKMPHIPSVATVNVTLLLVTAKDVCSKPLAVSAFTRYSLHKFKLWINPS